MNVTLKMTTLAMLSLLSNASFAGCSIEYAFWAPPPSHQVIYSACDTQSSAYAACSAFATEHNYLPEDVCGWGWGPGYHAGNLFYQWPSVPQPYALEHFIVPELMVPDKNTGCCSYGRPKYLAGDPVNPGVGNKVETRTEYSGTGVFPLTFTWTYNSLNAWPGTDSGTSLGRHRTHTYSMSIELHDQGLLNPVATVHHADGKATYFSQTSTGGPWVADGDAAIKLTVNPDPSAAWQVEEFDGRREWFDAAGRLIVAFDKSGNRQTLSYDGSGRLTTVVDPGGRSLVFVYVTSTSGLISTLQLPDGSQIGFSYNGTSDLSTVSYPGGTSVQFLYDESGHSAASASGLLTGEIDEKGVRYSTTDYDAIARAIATSQAGPSNSHGIAYSAPDVSGDYAKSTVSEPLGSTQTTRYKLIAGIAQPREITRTCTGCASQQTTYTYDANGLVQTSIVGGVQTDYTYDARGLIASRTDASNATGPDAQVSRTTGTTWDSAFRVPTEKTVKKLPGHNRIADQVGLQHPWPANRPLRDRARQQRRRQLHVRLDHERSGWCAADPDDVLRGLGRHCGHLPAGRSGHVGQWRSLDGRQRHVRR